MPPPEDRAIEDDELSELEVILLLEEAADMDDLAVASGLELMA